MKLGVCSPLGITEELGWVAYEDSSRGGADRLLDIKYPLGVPTNELISVVLSY